MARTLSPKQRFEWMVNGDRDLYSIAPYQRDAVIRKLLSEHRRTVRLVQRLDRNQNRNYNVASQQGFSRACREILAALRRRKS